LWRVVDDSALVSASVVLSLVVSCCEILVPLCAPLGLYFLPGVVEFHHIKVVVVTWWG